MTPLVQREKQMYEKALKPCSAPTSRVYVKQGENMFLLVWAGLLERIFCSRFLQSLHILRKALVTYNFPFKIKENLLGTGNLHPYE